VPSLRSSTGPLLVAEVAPTYDWLVVPVDVPYGSVTTVQSVMYQPRLGRRAIGQGSERLPRLPSMTGRVSSESAG
jgi:hypothetical protein